MGEIRHCLKIDRSQWRRTSQTPTALSDSHLKKRAITPSVDLGGEESVQKKKSRKTGKNRSVIGSGAKTSNSALTRVAGRTTESHDMMAWKGEE